MPNCAYDVVEYCDTYIHVLHTQNAASSHPAPRCNAYRRALIVTGWTFIVEADGQGMSKTSITLTTLFGNFWRWFQGKGFVEANVSTGLPSKLPQSWRQRGKASHIFWDIENLKLPASVKKQAPRFAYNLRTFFSASRIITAVENPLADPSTSQLLGVLSTQCNVEVLSYIRPKIKVTGLSPGSADFQIKQVCPDQQTKNCTFCASLMSIDECRLFQDL